MESEENLEFKSEIRFSRREDQVFKTVYSRPKGTSKWSVHSKTAVEHDSETDEYVPMSETRTAIREREAVEQEKILQAKTEEAKKSAISHQRRIDDAISQMTDVEYAFFSQLDDIKVLLGGVRADSKFADEIAVAPKFGMGAYLLGRDEGDDSDHSKQ